IGATFSEAMDHLTITNINYTLTTDAGAVVPGTVSYAGVSAAFKPLTNLANSTHYNVTIKGGTTGVKDLAGNAMVNDFKIGWTTAAAPDTTAPTVTTTVNANGAINVAVNTKVGATFSEAMDPLTITNVNFSLKNTATGAAVAGTVSYTGLNTVFIPLNNLAFSTNYTATIKGATGVKDLAGNAMVNDYVWSWTTGVAPDTTPPTVTGTINANGATNVAINTKDGATFSEAMNPLTITNLNYTLKETLSGNPVVGTVGYTGVHAVFIPLSNLAYNTNYTATIRGGISGVEDMAGNPMVSDFVWSWTTGAILDTFAPAIIANFPLADTNPPGAGVVPLNTLVTATFSEAMDPLTITAANFRLVCATRPPTAATVSYVLTSNSSVATLRPLNDLLQDDPCTATVTTGVKDLAGNALASDYNWTFRTETAAAETTTTTTTTTTHFLRRAAGFAVLAGAITNNAATTVINTGDVGGSSITAAPTISSGAYYTTGAPTYDNAMTDLPAVIAAARSTITYPCATTTAGGMGTVTMTPGVHCIAADAAISGVVILTLNGPGVYMFRTAGALATSAGSSVVFSGGANNTNTTVYWVVGSSNVGSPGTFVGTILSDGALVLGDGDTLLNGRVLTTAAVTLTNNTITKPVP
ncbi:MAG: Ig-like domain-containing protein, partial [Sterolibacterium sp.]